MNNQRTFILFLIFNLLPTSGHGVIPHLTPYVLAHFLESSFIKEMISDLFCSKNRADDECFACGNKKSEIVFYHPAKAQWFFACFASETCCRGAHKNCLNCLHEMQTKKSRSAGCQHCGTRLPAVILSGLVFNPKEESELSCISCQKSPRMRNIFSCDKSPKLYCFSRQPSCSHWQEYCFRCLKTYQNPRCRQSNADGDTKCPFSSCYEQLPGIVKRTIFF